MKEKCLFNEKWKFKKEEEIFQSVTEDYFDSYKNNTKTGLMSGAKSIAFYDKDWETVDLPHDWVISYDPKKELGTSQGYRPQGVVWYRKQFVLDEKYKNKKIFLKFDGIASTSEIYFNNIKVGASKGGYTPIFADVTDFTYFDRNNTVAVRADSTCKEGWWYEGGGIYRNTYIIIKESSYFCEDGIFVTTNNNGDGTWSVNVECETVNPDNCEIVYEFLGKSYTENSFNVENPLLWDCKNPNLYEIKVQLRKDGITYDEETVKFGFREIAFDSEKGFFVNGKSDKLKGVCLHHDHGGVGVAVDKSVLKYRLKKLREMGCNAIRTSHNPQSPEFYEACDELGFYVMNEIRHFSSSENCLKELSLFVKRDRNHPCVVMWSLFNEEPLQCTPNGGRIIKTMLDTLHKFDTTRPVTGGMNGPLEIEGVVNYVDIMGFNYLQYGYDEFHKLFPNIPIIGSETGSYLTTRDEYETKPELSHVSCYERKARENLFPWSATPGETWEYISKRPYVSGGFYWTGIDYYGEPGPFHWPGITSNFGAMDICGFYKDCAYWHKALWSEEHVLEIPEPWNGKNGENIVIVCYSDCDTIELLVNNKSLGEEKNNVYNPKVYNIPYEEGELKAIGRIKGQITCEKVMHTYGKERILEIIPSEKEIFACDSVVFDVYLKDEYGQIVKNEDTDVKITLENGILLGSANGDNANHRSALSDVQTLFHGCAQFIVKPAGQGNLVALFVCEKISKKCEINVLESTVKSIPSSDFVFYANNYMISDVIDHYPTEYEMSYVHFAWIPTTVGVKKSLMMSGKQGFAMLSGNVDIPDLNFKSKRLVIEKIAGDFDVYISNDRIYSSDGFFEGNVTVVLDEYDKKIGKINIVFKLNKENCGIGGNIYLKTE